MLQKQSVEFGVIPLIIPYDFVRSVGKDTEWTVLGGKHGARAKIANLARVLREKDEELRQTEELLIQATESLAMFHLKQETLLTEFTTLREKYESCKANLRDVLWNNTATSSKEYDPIPPLMRSALENEHEVEKYSLGSHLGLGRCSVVRGCKLISKDKNTRSSKRNRSARRLAVKIIDKSHVQSVFALQAIANEIRVLREASHPNIVSIVEVINTPLRLYMVMERGSRDLFQVIQEAKTAGKAMTEEKIRTIARQILCAIVYLHGMHVCHLDLKPENLVLVEKDDEESQGVYAQVKLIDFGSCAATTGSCTMTGVIGTPGYFAPEMVLHNFYNGFLADVWSIGVICLELVCGHDSFSSTWLPAYCGDGPRSPEEFYEGMTSNILNMRKNIRQEVRSKNVGAACQDAVFAALMTDPAKRIAAEDFYSHRWIGGKR